MTECQGCGAWNDTSRTLCVLCGTPLAETDEWDAATVLPPLPPLPDGGLRASMPTWLREPLGATPSSLHSPPGEASPLGPRADPRTFLSDDDFPRWLRDLAARRDETAPTASQTANIPPHSAAAAVELVPPAGWPSWSGLAAATPPADAPAPDGASVAPVTAGSAPENAATNAPAVPPAPTPAPDGRPPAAVVAARALEERRGREPWETLLLVLLFIGVLVAALWALVSNGVFSPGL